MTPQEVINNINQAYTNRVYIRGNRYRGISNGGIEKDRLRFINAVPLRDKGYAVPLSDEAEVRE